MQIPQCPICLTLLTQDLELVRPDNCGHVMCRKCAILLAKDNPKCPFCSASARLKELKQVVLSYGEYDVPTEQHAACPPSDDTIVDLNERTVSDKNSIIARGEQTLRLLDDVANSDPLEWRMPSSGGGHDKGLVFARTGRLINEIGSSVECNDRAKELLMKLGQTVTSLQSCYRKTVDLASLYRSAVRENASLKARQSEQELLHAVALQSKDIQLARKDEEHAAREEVVKEKMVRMRRALEAARMERSLAQEETQEMERTHRKVVRKMKKLRSMQASSSQTPDTDSSLEILDEDDEPVPEPSSSATSTSSGSQIGAHEPSSKISPEHVSASKTRPPIAKPLSTSKVRAPLRSSATINTSKILARTSSSPQDEVELELDQDHTVSSVLKLDPALHNFTTALLLGEARPATRTKPASYSSSSNRARSQPRPPVSTGSRAPAKLGIPSNPLAAATSRQDASWREKKRPRLTLR